MNEKKKFGTAQKANGSCSCVDKNDIPNNKNNNTKGGNAWVGGVLITNFEGGKNEIPILREKRNKHLQLPGESEKKTRFIYWWALGMAATRKSQCLLNGKQK